MSELIGLDESQAKIVNDNLQFETDFSIFKKNIENINYNKMKHFLNSCFYIIESGNFQSQYCIVIKNILLFISIEALMGRENYVGFNCWLKAKKDVPGCKEKDKLIETISPANFKDIVHKLYNDVYIKNYGITEHVRKFFRNYIPLEDKKTIITSYTEQNKKDNIFVSRCFFDKEKCFKYNGSDKQYTHRCTKLNHNDCILYESEEKVNKALDKTISKLYHIFRNEVIHKGERGNILVSHSSGEGKCASNNLLLCYTKDGKSKNVRLTNGLNVDKFREIILKGIRKYYEREIKNGN